MLTDESPFAIREAFNQLRTNLMYTAIDVCDGAPVFAVTSANESAGKSTIVKNLAVSFTNLGKKVLLIDGDLRCPVLHTFFDIKAGATGLSEYISGIESDVIMRDILPNLDLITSGRIPPNPSDLITSPKFTEAINAWKKEYDVIFIDFPPVGIVTDSIANSKIVNGYIFVIRSGDTSAKIINTTIESMEQIGAKIAGVVLNDYNIKGSRYYKHRNSRYYKSGEKKYKYSAEKNIGI